MVIGAVVTTLFGCSAAAFAWLATPSEPGAWTRIDDRVSCDAGWVAWVLIGTLVSGLIGLGVFAVGLARMKRGPRWDGAVLSATGIALVTCGAAALYLGVQLSYAASCD